MPIRIAYLSHDLDDAATARRVAMLQAGGADVIVAGFRRTAQVPRAIEGAPVYDLGRTVAMKLFRRLPVLLAAVFNIGRFRRFAAAADVFLCRNLDALVLAWLTRALFLPKAKLVYECLDVHRAMVGDGGVGVVLRGVERWLLRRCHWLAVSSPGFDRFYFAPRIGYTGPILLIENQPLRLDGLHPVTAARPPLGAPWRIGLFGDLRCRRSLVILADLVRDCAGAVEVVLRGRPSRHAAADFDQIVGATPGMTYLGPYDYRDLGAIYGEVHFAWAIDYFEAAANSVWLLPNRLYESALNGAVPIAEAETETARWLSRRGVGVTVADPGRDLKAFFAGLTADTFAELRRGVLALPPGSLCADRARCQRIVQALAGLNDAPPEALRPRV